MDPTESLSAKRELEWLVRVRRGDGSFGGWFLELPRCVTVTSPWDRVLVTTTTLFLSKVVESGIVSCSESVGTAHCFVVEVARAESVHCGRLQRRGDQNKAGELRHPEDRWRWPGYHHWWRDGQRTVLPQYAQHPECSVSSSACVIRCGGWQIGSQCVWHSEEEKADSESGCC